MAFDPLKQRFSRHEKRLARREARRQADEMLGLARSDGHTITRADGKRYVRGKWREIAAFMRSQLSFPWQENGGD